MIYFMTKGHTLEHDVQTIIQVFYPNMHYYVTQEPAPEGIQMKGYVKEKKPFPYFMEMV